MGASAGPGTIVAGRYRLREPLGEGGFGVVYRAEDQQLQRPVALKLLLRDVVEVGARFRREAELAMRLSHPNTVRTLDAGEDAGAGPYIAMELLEGVSLEAHLRTQGPIAPERAAQIVRAVLGSLEEAHGLGIVHRDIKPANVFLVRGPAPAVKVLDFGIAKSTNADTRAGLTREGQTIGTPAYMAPEQVSGGALGPETDLYAVGLVLAEAISGRPVYDGLGGLAVLVDKLNGKVAPLPTSLVGTPLGAVVSRALAHERSSRFASAADMRRALDEAVSRMPDDTFGPGELRVLRQPSGGWSAEQTSPGSGPATARTSSASLPVPLSAPSEPSYAPTHEPSFAPTHEPSFAPTMSAIPTLAPAVSSPQPSFPAFPLGPPAPAPRVGSGLAIGCLAGSLMGVVVLGVAVGVLWLTLVSPVGQPRPRAPASAAAPRPAPSPGGESERSAPRGAPAQAHLVRCPKLAALAPSSLNPAVWSAGFGVGDQSSNQGDDSYQLDLGLTQAGEGVGALSFYEGPSVQARLEQAKATAEGDVTYALTGRRLLFISLSPVRAGPLLGKIC